MSLPDKAFILEIDAGPAPALQQLRGRIELVATGRSAAFADRAALASFVSSCLPSSSPGAIRDRTAPAGDDDGSERPESAGGPGRPSQRSSS